MFSFIFLCASEAKFTDALRCQGTLYHCPYGRLLPDKTSYSGRKEITYLFRPDIKNVSEQSIMSLKKIKANLEESIWANTSPIFEWFERYETAMRPKEILWFISNERHVNFSVARFDAEKKTIKIIFYEAWAFWAYKHFRTKKTLHDKAIRVLSEEARNRKMAIETEIVFTGVQQPGSYLCVPLAWVLLEEYLKGKDLTQLTYSDIYRVLKNYHQNVTKKISSPLYVKFFKCINFVLFKTADLIDWFRI